MVYIFQLFSFIETKIDFFLYRHFSNIVKWFFRLAHIEKSANRQFAIEVMGQLLVQNERENPSEQGVQGLDHDYGGLIQKPTENGIDQV